MIISDAIGLSPKCSTLGWTEVLDASQGQRTQGELQRGRNAR